MEWTPIIVEINAEPNNSYENFKKVIAEILSNFGEGSIKSKSDVNAQSNEPLFLMYVNSEIEKDVKEFIDKSQYVKRSKTIDNILASKEPLASEDLFAIFFDKNRHISMVCKDYKCKTTTVKFDNQP